MKRIVLLIGILICATLGYAQTPAPIAGNAFVCMGSPSLLTDATPGGTWSSSNTAVATIGTSGVIVGISLGPVIITYAIGTSYATKLITVKSVPTLSPASISGCVNSSYQMFPAPGGGSWGSGNPAVATVDFLGVVTGISPGVTTIMYTEAGGCSVNATITVNPIPSAITGTNFVYSGLTTSLADVTPGGTWSSNNVGLATVGAGTGIVTGVSAGLVLISYTLPTSCAAFYKVEVNPMPAKNNVYAWYPFCGDTTDKGAAGRDLINHGIATAPAVLTTDRFGNANNAYSFNGVNSMMNYTTFFANSGIPNDFTYSCWVNIPANQSSIIWYNGDPNLNGFGMVVNGGTMGVPGNQAGIFFGATGLLYASQGLTLGTWHNLVLVKNGGVYNFYVDNAPGVFFIEVTSPVFTDAFALGLNYHSTLPGFGPIKDAFNGSIDDVVYITRQLTNAERLSLFNFNPDAKKFALGNDTTICSDKIELIPDPQTVGALYKWSRFNGLGYTLIDTVDTVLAVYPAIGPFGNEYVLNVSKPFGCSVSDTIIVYKAPIPVTLGPDLHVCDGDTLTLTNFFPSANFLWSTGDTAHSIKVTSTGVYYVTVDSIYNGSTCVGRDTVKINFHAIPLIGLPASVRHCSGDPDTLRPFKDPAYTYVWSTGVTSDSLRVIASGTYWVQVSDSGCKRTDTTNVLIVFDTVTFHLKDTAICAGDPIYTTNWVTLNPIVTYQWTPTAGIQYPNTPQPKIEPDTSAEYILRVSYPGCPDLVDSFHADVQPKFSVFIGGNRDVCEGDTIHIKASMTPEWYNAYQFSWSPSTSLDCSTCSTVIFTAGDTTKLILTVKTPAWRTGLNSGQCISLDSGAIYVHPRFFDTMTSMHSLCPGDSVQLIPMDTSTRGVINVAYHWTPGIYLDDSTSSKPWVRPLTSESYRLVAVNQFGCTDTMVVDINVHPDALMNIGDSVVIYPGESYQIDPQTNCTYFDWYPPLGLDNIHISNPKANPDVSTMYIVRATTESGCVTVDSFKIHVDPNSFIAMPNAFAPGSMGNTTFSVIKRGLVSLNFFRIFNRWGVLMFETKNIDEGWDGSYKGKPQPFGVYVYELEAVTNTGKIVTRQGNVTLIR